MSKVNNEEFEKAYFIQRLGAFLIDLFIVGFIAAIATMPFQTDSIQTQ